MKRYNKLLLGALAILVAMAITSYNSVTNYQKGIFDDENKIAEEGDSYTYSIRQGKSAGNEANIKFTSFWGMDTVFEITSAGENDVVFNFESVIDNGDFKVVLITPDNEVVNILEGTKKVSETISLKDGTSRIKLVGRKARGEIKIKIDSGENVDIKGTD